MFTNEGQSVDDFVVILNLIVFQDFRKVTR